MKNSKIIIRNTEELNFVPTSHTCGQKKIFLSGVETLSNITQIALAKLNAGETIEEHSHSTMEENFIVVSGKGQIALDGKTHSFTKGQFVLVPSEVKHSISAISDIQFYSIGVAVKNNEDKKYFNVRLEFNKDRFDQIIADAIQTGKVGYVCSVESNNLTVANTNPEFLKVINGALVNNPDGSMLSKILGCIRKEPLASYIGADIFIKYIKMCKYRQFFLGNTEEVLAGLKENLSQIDPKIKEMRFETLPFRKVEDFDYKSIAEMINEDNSDIIWVSLGAPKQEMFMSKLQPYLKRGVMFGFGAIFNFNAGTGEVKRAPKWMLKLRLEWLHRAFEQPKKNIPRYWNFIKILPKLIREEKKKVKKQF